MARMMNQYFRTGGIPDYLASHSGRISIPGAEPFFIEGGSPTAFLLLHGWSASAESTRFLAAGLAKAGHSVLAPTLPGHGSSAEDMLNYGPVDWTSAAREAAQLLRRHYDRVIVLGISMGGSLAIQLAGSSPDLADALITVNAPVLMSNSSFADEIVSGDAADYLSGWSVPEFFGEHVDEISYPRRFKKSGADLYSMCALAREILPKVVCPTLVVQSVLDPIVPKDSAVEILNTIGAAQKQALWLDQSYHVSQLDLDRDRIVSVALAFAGDSAALDHARTTDAC